MKAKYYTIAFDARRFPTLAAAKVAIQLADNKERYNNTMILGHDARDKKVSFTHIQSADYFVHFKKTYKYGNL